MKKLLIIMGLLGFLSCNGVYTPLKKGYTKSFVLWYYSVSDLEMHWRNDGFIELLVVPNGETYDVLSTDIVSKAKYDAKCDLHGDNGYNRDFYYDHSWINNRFQDRDFASINLTSDADYDDTHPAGSSLNDLFYFASSSPAEYIKRGYSEPYNWKNTSTLPEYYIGYLDYTSSVEVTGNAPVYGLVSQLEAKDMILLGGTNRWQHSTLATLTPVREPTQSKCHNITIVLVDTDGDELSTKLPITFQ